MNYRIEMVDDLMTLIDDEHHGQDAHIVDPTQPWEAVAALVRWGGEYQLDASRSLRVLRTYLKACE